MNIFEKLKERGFDTVQEDFYTNIGVWKSWYDGEVKDFHRYKVFNGQKSVQCRRYTMGMGKKVAEDWANLLMNEKVKITLEGKKEQEFFDSVCTENNFLVKVSEMQEMKSATGTAAYVPRIVGASINSETGIVSGAAESIKLDYCTAENIFPLSWENGRVIECAFATSKTIGNDKYLYTQIHRIVGWEYIIENVLYKDNNGSLSEVELGTVKGFEGVPATVHTGSDKRQFVIDRLNIANNIDNTLPMGVSVYANAIDQLKGVDIAYDSYVNEFVLGKKRIMVKPEATKDLDGEPLFDPNDTVFYVLPEDTQNGNIIDQIDMTLRTAEHNAGLQDMLNALSSKCGFGENHYKFDSGSIATATQVISENSSMFRTIKKHEIILEDVLIELCRIILRLGNTYMSAGLNEDVEISIDFDDSIIEDKATDFSRDMQLLNAGIMNDWEFRMKWMNEDKKTAKAALPKMPIIDRNSLSGLIPEPVTREIIQGAIAESAVLRMGRRLPNMTSKTQTLNVLDALPTAYFVNAEATSDAAAGTDAYKQTTAMAWDKKKIYAEEIAVIVPIPEAVLEDSDYDIWGEVRPRLTEAFGKVIDGAILFGKNKPTTWREGLVPSAVSASATVAATTDIFTDIMGEDGVIAKVEESGYIPNGAMAAIKMRAKLRGLKDTTGQPIFKNDMQGATRYALDGMDTYFPINGAFDTSAALAIIGDWSQLVYSIRQDMTFKIFDSGVIQDPTTKEIQYNLIQNDMVALRAVMRLGWEIPNPITAYNADIENAFPFAVYTPSVGG